MEEKIKEFEPIIEYVVSNAPSNLRDDCKQAAYCAIIDALQNRKIKNEKSYIYMCAKNAVLKEIARLSEPFSLSTSVFLELTSYRRLLATKKISIEDVPNKYRDILSYNFVYDE